MVLRVEVLSYLFDSYISLDSFILQALREGQDVTDAKDELSYIGNLWGRGFRDDTVLS
jgi:hypothetical protein